MSSMNFKITGLGVSIPEKQFTNHDFEKILDTNDEWIVKRTGIRTRYFAAESEFASDLGIRAVQNLIDKNNVSVDDVDFIIATALVPDHITPSIASLVAGHFSLRGAATYDLHAACSGFAYGLITANAYLMSGLAKKVLIIAAETPSKALDFTDRGTCILFGDGAVAALVERDETSRLFVSGFGTDGDLADKVFCSLYSTSINGIQLGKERLIDQDGRMLYAYVIKNISVHIQELLEKAGMTVSDIDWFVPHSANLRMIDALREKVGFSAEQMLTSVEEYGNTSSASIPLALSMALDRGVLQRGQKVLIYGFGAGLTYAGAIFEW